MLQVIPDRAFTVRSLAGDINDLGDVTVSYRKADGTFGYYLYNAYNPDPSTAISDLGITVGDEDSSRPILINNEGVIVGRLGNGNGFRISSIGVFETFPGLRPIAMNENGAFCGTATVTTTKPRGTANYAFVYETSLTVNKIANSATDLNESLDSVVFYNWLNHRTFGNLTIKDLLDPTDSDSSLISSLSCKTMTDRDPEPNSPVTNFPVLGGSAAIGGIYMGMHLIPVPAP